MGLSREDTPRLDTLKAAIDLTQAISALIANPKILKDAVADVYGLSEQEQKKAEAAKADIKANQDVLLENKKLLASIEEEQDNLDVRSGEIQKISAALDARQNQINKDNEAMKTAQNDNVAKANELNTIAKNLADKEAALIAKETALNERQTKNEEYENSLKERAAQFRELTAGL